MLHMHTCIWKCAMSSGGNQVERGKAKQTDMALRACLRSRGSHMMYKDEEETRVMARRSDYGQGVETEGVTS